jgi:hypothetical protein
MNLNHPLDSGYATTNWIILTDRVTIHVSASNRDIRLCGEHRVRFLERQDRQEKRQAEYLSLRIQN